ncbi:MAG: DUF6588 family protein [Bdellovibrionales bacterium]
MYSFRKVCGFLCLILVSMRVHAVNIPLQNVTDDDLKKVVGDMSANFLHTSVSGAGTLGHLWGVEVGVVGGQASTPGLNDVVHKADPNADASKLYNAELLGVVTVPFGITGELGVVPSTTLYGIKVNSLDLAAKWTVTELFLSDLPFSLAGKVAYTTNTINFSQVVGSNTVDYTYKNVETSATVLISKNLAILEPYAGVGIVNAKGTLDANAPIYLGSAKTSADASRSGMMWQVGTEVKLLVLKLGVEYAHVLDTSRVSGKLSFYF